jgi:hypothetical protein
LGQQAAGKFDHHERRGQRECDAQDAAARAGGVVVIVVVVAMTMVVSMLGVAMRVAAAMLVGAVAVLMTRTLIVLVLGAAIVPGAMAMVRVPWVVHGVRISRLAGSGQTSKVVIRVASE